MRRLLLPVLACALLLVGIAPAAVASTTAPSWASRTDYVALGDSYSAGVGATPDPTSGTCKRSDRSFPSRFAAENDVASFRNVACSGDTSLQVLLHQVRAVGKDTDLVTLTVGGNDSGFSTVLGVCSIAQRDEDCTRAVNGGERIARYVLPAGLTAIIGGVRLQAPRARLVVLGYPRLFAPGSDCDTPLVPNATRRAAINGAADVLNGSLRATAQRWQAEFVDVSGAFADHGVCSADPWINPPTNPPVSGNYHPTAEGYAKGYLPALDAVART